MPRRKDSVEQGLLRKGVERQEGVHHYFIYPVNEPSQKGESNKRTSSSIGNDGVAG